MATVISEYVVANKNGFSLSVSHHPVGNPRNRITLRSFKTNDIKETVFEGTLKDNKIILQYSFYYHLDDMVEMLQLVKENEEMIIEYGNKIWKS